MQLSMGENPFEKLSSEVLYSRPYIRFVKEKVRIGDVEKDYSYVDIANGIGMVAINKKNEVALVGQWRYPIGKYTWEIPAGMREDEEDPLICAKRELEEEAGVTAKKWEKLGEWYMEASSTTKKTFAYLAMELENGDVRPEDDERIEVMWVPFEETIRMVHEGEIRDGLTVLGLLRAQEYLRGLE